MSSHTELSQREITENVVRQMLRHELRFEVERDQTGHNTVIFRVNCLLVHGPDVEEIDHFFLEVQHVG